VFMTAGPPITKLFAWGGDRGGLYYERQLAKACVALASRTRPLEQVVNFERGVCVYYCCLSTVTVCVCVCSLLKILYGRTTALGSGALISLKIEIVFC